MSDKNDSSINIVCKGVKKEICDKPPPTKNFKITPYSEKPKDITKTTEKLSQKYGF